MYTPEISIAGYTCSSTCFHLNIVLSSFTIMMQHILLLSDNAQALSTTGAILLGFGISLVLIGIAVVVILYFILKRYLFY